MNFLLQKILFALCVVLSLATSVYAEEYYDDSYEAFQTCPQGYYQDQGCYQEQSEQTLESYYGADGCTYCEPSVCEPQLFTPFQLSLFNPAQIFPEEYSVHGIRVNILYGSNNDVSGLDLGIVNRVNGNMAGVQIGAVNYVKGDFMGLRRGLVNATRGNGYGIETSLLNLTHGNFYGWQDALLANHVKKSMVGVQAASYNYASCMTGFQVGFVNHTQTMTGLQVGLVNCTHMLKGIQIGLVNIQTERVFLKVLPIINVSL